jgi:hypothetical protein
MMSETASYEPRGTLPAHRAFVVHFGRTEGRRRRFSGRVEHLTSGRWARFASLGALLAFFAELLDEPREP